MIDTARPHAEPVVVKVAGLAAAIPGPAPTVPVVPAVTVPIVSEAVVVHGLGRSDVGVVRVDDDFLRRSFGRGAQADAGDQADRRKNLREAGKGSIHPLMSFRA